MPDMRSSSPRHEALGALGGFGQVLARAGELEGAGGDGRGGSGEQAPEGVSAVAGEFHTVGDLAEGGLDPVAPFRDDLE